MRRTVFVSMFIAACAIPAVASADCYKYDYAEITLNGEVVLKVPAQKVAGTHRNPGERHAFLKLDKPVCVVPGTNTHESGEDNQGELTLYSLNEKGVGQFSGKYVSVRGVLMHSFVADSHTPLQFIVNDITEAVKPR